MFWYTLGESKASPSEYTTEQWLAFLDRVQRRYYEHLMEIENRMDAVTDEADDEALDIEERALEYRVACIEDWRAHLEMYSVIDDAHVFFDFGERVNELKYELVSDLERAKRLRDGDVAWFEKQASLGMVIGGYFKDILRIILNLSSEDAYVLTAARIGADQVSWSILVERFASWTRRQLEQLVYEVIMSLEEPHILYEALPEFEREVFERICQ